MEKRHISIKKEYERYFDPSLIFKINLIQNVSDISFRDELRRLGIKTISSVPGKDGYQVVFASDVHLAKFRQKLEARIQRGDRATFVDAIGSIEEIPQDEKLGESLQAYPLKKSDKEHIDVEIWRMKKEKLCKFLDGLKKLVKNHNCKITDEMRTKNFCVVRIRMDQHFLNVVTSLREVAHADRPVDISIIKQFETDIRKIDIKGPPPEGSPGILVMDSGIRRHPLLEDSIADSIVLVKRGGRTVDDIDDSGHGTQVAGIALYGDLSSYAGKSFDPRLWLYSAKIMYNSGGYAKFDPDQLLEHQFKDAVERTITKHKNCRVINLSLGNLDNKMYKKQNQFRLASLIDELSFKHKDIMFTVAAGNNFDGLDGSKYPKQMLEESRRVKIIDPASSAYALTVGASFPSPQRRKTTTASSSWPSPLTRVGPGLNGMIKPELIANGGGHTSDLLTINPRWVNEGRPFTLDSGTSFSSPMVAHYLGMLQSKFPSESRNMLKALVLSSATVPQEKPPSLDEIARSGKSNDMQKILNVYGYGVPDLDNALASDDNRVLLKHDGKISPDDAHFFPVMVPDEFYTERGRRSIEIVLVFDPPTRRNRADYLGVSMNCRLYKNSSLKTIQELYGQIKKRKLSSKHLRKKEISMFPKITARNRGVHQKSIKEWVRKPELIASKPLVLIVTCQKKWYSDNKYEQPYAVVMTIKHEKPIDIYNPIVIKNKVRIRARSRV